MPSYEPIVKNAAAGAILFYGLPSATASGAMQANPTLAAGDVQVSKDGGALANLATLPVVTPAGSRLVKITLSQAEINADNVAIVFADQTSPKEWCDTIISIATVARNFDDLAYPLVSGRYIDADGAGAVNVSRVNGAPQTARDLGLQLDATVSSRLAAAAYTAPDNATIAAIAGYVDTEVAAIKAKTDNLPAAPAAVGDIPTAIANADALLDRAAGVETGLTVRQALRVVAAVLFGKASGMATTTARFRDTGDTKDRVVATVDADGNRTAVTLSTT